MFQSTRPRGARRLWSAELRYFLCVSIHAPAWGATIGLVSYDHTDNCFNPRARVGRDKFSSRTEKSRPRFNPRARVGRDARNEKRAANSQSFQSTRPRGARRHRPCGLAQACSFNPRARVGRDMLRQVENITREKFQSTRPRGARPKRAVLHAAAPVVSIHAPAWGATAIRAALRSSPCRFQSTRPRGARHGDKTTTHHHYAVSIHAPAWGATKIRRLMRSVAKVSIHAPAWGATIGPDCFSGEYSGFNPRARVGRDGLIITH